MNRIARLRSCPYLVVLTLCIACTRTNSWAVGLDETKLPTGDNHDAAHAYSTGTGIDVAIIEPDAGVNIINFVGTRMLGEYSFDGKVPGDTPANNIAATDDHATLEANIIAGNDPTYMGVANGANLYVMSITGPGNTGSGSTHNDGDDSAHDNSFNSFRGAIAWLGTNVSGYTGDEAYLNHAGVHVFSNSWGPDYETGDNGDNRFARFVDFYTQKNDSLFIAAAGNHATNSAERISWPWDAYNGITVGALARKSDNDFTPGEYRNRADFSQYWLSNEGPLQADVRGKPDILAPGEQLSDGVSYGGAPQSGTSFAAPAVAGTAALIMERGKLGLPSGFSNHLAIKAIILNSARKRSVNGPQDSFKVSQDKSIGFYSRDYLSGGALAVGSSATPVGTITGEWTPVNWSFNGTLFQTTSPLDEEQGVGSLDAGRAMTQVDGGEQLRSTENPAGVTSIGYALDTIQLSTPMHIYPLNFSLTAGTFITTTLVWDRIVNEVNAADGIAGVVDTGDSYSLNSVTGLPDLDLRIFYKGLPIASSISITDNVEHLHIPIWNESAPGDYSIRVAYDNENRSGATYVNYGLAWWTVAAVPEPGGSMLVVSAVLMSLPFRRRLE